MVSTIDYVLDFLLHLLLPHIYLFIFLFFSSLLSFLHSLFSFFSSASGYQLSTAKQINFSFIIHIGEWQLLGLLTFLDPPRHDTKVNNQLKEFSIDVTVLICFFFRLHIPMIVISKVIFTSNLKEWPLYLLIFFPFTTSLFNFLFFLSYLPTTSSPFSSSCFIIVLLFHLPYPLLSYLFISLYLSYLLLFPLASSLSLINNRKLLDVPLNMVWRSR